MKPSFWRKTLAGVAALAIAGTTAVSTATPAVAATLPDPTIHYDFDSAPTGTTLRDVSGNDYHATVGGSGATYANGVMSFPGGSATSTAAYLTIPTTPITSSTTDVTISVWLKNKTGSGNYAAAYIGAAKTASYPNNGYWLLNPANPNGYVKSVLTTATAAAPSTSPWGTEVGPGNTNSASTGVKSTTDMALYTTVIDGTNDKLRTYLNGTLIMSTSVAADLTQYGTLYSYLGKSSYADKFFAGDVDDYALYTSALSDAQVGDLYAGQALDRAVAGVTVASEATADFTVPVTASGAAITWASSSPVIAVDSAGKATVTRPSSAQGDATAVLTATFSVAGSTRTKDYTVKVPKQLTETEKAQADLDAVAIHSADNMRTNFSVPTTGKNGSTIAWTVKTAGVADPVISDGQTATTKKVAIERPAAGAAATTAVLTATVSNGSATLTKDFPVVVPAMPADDAKTEAYIWAFFTGEGDGAERVSLAASKGNDALNWNTLNDGKPLFISDKGTEGLRDPFILRSHDGDKFFMLATDLKVAGLSGGFTTAQLSGSKYIEVWESDDLVHWTNQRHVKVSTDYAGNTWAPEAYWDAELGTYVVYWASNLYDTTDASARTAVTYNRMMYATTDDFVTFSEPQKWIDVKRGTGLGAIDTTVAKVGDTYYRFYKDEASMTIREEKSTDLLAKVATSLPTTTGTASTWTLIKEKIANGLSNGAGGTFSAGEGPSIFPANEGDANDYDWFLFIDQPSYHGGPDHYIPFASNDLNDGSSWVSVASKLNDKLPQNADGGKPRHGTVIPVTRAEYQKVLQAYQPSIAVKSVAPLTATTSAGVAPELPASATLTMHDDSTKTATVKWDAVDPSAYANLGTFTVRGIAQNDSREPVEATVTVGVADTNTSLTSLVIAGTTVDFTDTDPTLVADPTKVTPADVVATTVSAAATTAVTVAAGKVTVVVTAGDKTTKKTYEVTLGSLVPSANYDMSHTGTKLLDTSGNGRDATLTNLGDSSFAEYAGAGKVLNFNKDGYATLPSGSVTGTDNDFTVEMTVTTQTAANQFGWVIGDGIGAWNTTELGNYVFVNPRSSETAYSGQVLSGIRVKTGTANGESRLPAGGSLNTGFTTLTMVSDDNVIKLYRDGQQISTLTHTMALSSIVPTGSTLGYLGRSLYSPDPLFTGKVSGVKLWDVALNGDQVRSAMPTDQQRADLSWANVAAQAEAKLKGTNTSLDAVTANLAFPASIDGVAVTWTSSNTAVVAADGKVTRPVADTPVTITLADGNGHTKAIVVTVKSVTASELDAKLQADLDGIALKPTTTENLPLVAAGKVNGSAITWTSSDPALVSATKTDYAAPSVGAADPYRGAGLVTRPAYGSGDKSVTLTASAKLGDATATKSFTIKVAELGRTAPDAGYAAAYFKSDSNEKIYQAATTGNDFFTFQPVNGGNAVITSTVDTKGLRDPYILRSHNGDKYYMIATDLCISCGTSWGDAQSKGSLKVEVWESTDLVNWTRTNSDGAGITVNQPEAGMTWAPEAYWDDALQSYVVFFSSRLYDDTAHTSTSGGGHARVFYVLTRDFTTFTYPPVEWQNTGYARIDSTVIKIGDYYYRFTKNEDSGAADGLEAGKDAFLEKSKVLTAVTKASSASTDPATGWQLVDTNLTSKKTGAAGEGPEIVKLNAGDPANTADNDGYVFLIDNYSAGGYVPFVTTGSAISASSMSNRLSQRADWVAHSKTGLPSSPRHGAFVNVPQTVLDALNSWTTVKAVASTTTLIKSGRNLTAKVTAADGGSVAGTVTFSAGDWSVKQPVVNGSASVDVPASVGGAVTASYDGYTDGLVKASSASIEVVKLAGLTAAITTAEQLKQADYTEASWAPLAQALAAAKAVLADTSVTQTAVDAATQALQTAQGGLVAVPVTPVVDRTALAAAIQAAAGVSETGYTSQSWQVFAGALTAARTTHDDAAASQAQVDAATKALTDAQAALVRVVPGKATKTTLKVSPTKARLGASGTAKFKVSATVKTTDGKSVTDGSVVFSAGSAQVTAKVSKGTAKATLTVAQAGSLKVSARYLGSTVNAASTVAKPVTIKVSKARSATKVSVSPKRTKLGSAGAATVLVTVKVAVAKRNGLASGQVRMKFAGVTQTVPVVAGVAKASVVVTKKGSFRATAAYLGSDTASGSSGRSGKVSVRR